MVTVRTKVRTICCSLRPKTLSAPRVPSASHYTMTIRTGNGQMQIYPHARAHTRRHLATRADHSLYCTVKLPQQLGQVAPTTLPSCPNNFAELPQQLCRVAPTTWTSCPNNFGKLLQQLEQVAPTALPSCPNNFANPSRGVLFATSWHRHGPKSARRPRDTQARSTVLRKEPPCAGGNLHEESLA